MVRVAGVDLSAEPKETAVAVLSCGDGLALESLTLGATNADIVRLTAESSKVGIDCAFGWPTAFVEFVAGHSSLKRIARGERELDIAWRRELAFRETDREVIRRTGKQPLSVSTDKLGLAAMRCAVLLEDLADAGRSVDRAGRGDVVEVYPAAAFSSWGILIAGYKRDPAKLSLLADRLEAEAHIDFGGFGALVRRSDDALDAVGAALIAVASHQGLCEPIPGEHIADAEREGWIAIPPPLSTILALGS